MGGKDLIAPKESDITKPLTPLVFLTLTLAASAISIILPTAAASPPATPTGCVSNTISFEDLRVACDATAGATGYTLYWSTSSHVLLADYEGALPCDPTVSDCEIDGQFEDVAPSTTYHFRVVASNADGDSSPTSDFTGTTSGDVPAQPTSCTLTQTTYPGMHIECTFDSSTIYFIAGVGSASQADITSYDVSFLGCDPSTGCDLDFESGTFFSRTRAYAGDKCPTDGSADPIFTPIKGCDPGPTDSDEFTGTIEGAAPAGCTAAQNGDMDLLISCSSFPFGDHAVVVWDTVSHSSSQDYALGSNDCYMSCDLGPAPPCSCPLEDGTTYHFRVYACDGTCSGTNFGADSLDFTGTPEDGTSPPAGAPANLATNPTSQSTVDITWDSVVGATGYSVFVGTTDDYVSGSVNDSSLAYFGHVDTLAATVTGLDPETTYYFRVVGTNSGGEGPASDSATATTDPTPPAPPVNPAEAASAPLQALLIILVGTIAVGFLFLLLKVAGVGLSRLAGGGQKKE